MTRKQSNITPILCLKRHSYIVDNSILMGHYQEASSNYLSGESNIQ
jgi:hypothetical protein